MKKLILVGGPAESEKTAVSKILNQKLSNSVFFNGDWCCQMDPFVLNETNKKMIMDNIHTLLNRFIKNPNLDHVVFCWTMDNQQIIDDIYSGLDLTDVKVIPVSLLPSVQKLTATDQQKNANADQKPADLQQAVEHLLMYQPLSTIKYDDSTMSPEETAAEIMTQI